MELIIRDLIDYKSDGQKVRVLWISPDLEKVVIIDIDDRLALPVFNEYKSVIDDIQENRAELIPSKDPHFFIVNEASLSQADKDCRDRRWHIVQGLIGQEPSIYSNKGRKKILAAAVKNDIASKPTLLKYLRLYWQRGMTKRAMLTGYRNCGGKGKDREPSYVKRGVPRSKEPNIGKNVTEDDKKMIKKGIKRHYFNKDKKKRKLETAYNDTIADFYRDKEAMQHPDTEGKILGPDDIISMDQFIYWYRKLFTDEREKLIAKHGEAKYESDHRGLGGSSQAEARGPGEKAQIDATIDNAYLVSRFDRNRIVGRGVTYYVLCVHSRLVMGVHCAIEGPSWVTAMMALANTAMDKVEYCKQFGIDIEEWEWPCSQLPQKFLADRGELASNNVESPIENLDIKIENTKSYRGDAKGIVEKNFNVQQEKFRPYVEGYVEKDIKERGDNDYRLDACLTLYEFTRIVIRCVLQHNRAMMENYEADMDVLKAGIDHRPTDLWHWGIEHKTGLSHKYQPEQIKVSLMPSKEARVTKEGIKLFDLYYICDRALKEQWLIKARNKTFTINISYDQRDMSNVYIILDDPELKYEICIMTPRSRAYEGMSLWEIQQIKGNKRKRLAEDRHQALQDKVDLADKIREEVDQAKAKKNKLPRPASKAEALNSIRENRSTEQKVIRSEEAFRLVESNSEDIPTRIEEKTSAKKPNRLLSIIQGHNSSTEDQQ